MKIGIKEAMVGLVIFLTIAIVGVVGLKKAGIIDNGPANNWIWEDNWPNSLPNKPNLPDNPVQPQQPQQTQPQAATTFEQAKRMSQESNRRILVMFTAEWCSWCQKMKNETLHDPGVQTAMQNYIFLMIDTDKDSSVSSKFGVRGLPTFVITDSTEAKLRVASGYQDKDKFIQFLN